MERRGAALYGMVLMMSLLVGLVGQDQTCRLEELSSSGGGGGSRRVRIRRGAAALGRRGVAVGVSGR